ncbi:MAG: hypothetical protein GXY50_02430 [Syntrophomonadaceae bacterium]|nr:hypothetical protein [Syntrophomonadaceae bacterium]
MFKVVNAYLFEKGTVVLNKNDIKDAKDESFQRVRLFLPYEFIKESAEELELILDEDDNF